MKLYGGSVIIKSTESPPARGAWIEICNPLSLLYLLLSPPARGAWIEIKTYLL